MESIGSVVGLTGSAQAESSEGLRPLALGSPVHAGEVLTTGPGSNIEIGFTDGTVLAQGENARLALDEYVYNPQDSGASTMLLNMAQGTFRMVTGELAKANPEGVTIQSPLATIGIRGTGADFDVPPGGPMRVGIFQYDGLDLTITTPFGTMVINNANLILDIGPGGQFGELRSYSELERAFFNAVAPILSIPVPGAPGQDEGQGGGDEGQGQGEGEGEGGEVSVSVSADEGFTEGDVLAFISELFSEALGDDSLLGSGEELPLLGPLTGGPGTGPTTTTSDDPTRQTTTTTTTTTTPGPTTPGNSLNGTAYADSIQAYHGPMTINGLAGPDTLIGSSDSDTIYGGAGNDFIDLGSGSDLGYGGTGNDSMLGSAGNDTLYGEAGDDTLDGGTGNDLLYGGDGSDSLLGGDGNDTLYGESGNDVLLGGASQDFL